MHCRRLKRPDNNSEELHIALGELSRDLTDIASGAYPILGHISPKKRPWIATILNAYIATRWLFPSTVDRWTCVMLLSLLAVGQPTAGAIRAPLRASKLHDITPYNSPDWTCARTFKFDTRNSHINAEHEGNPSNIRGKPFRISRQKVSSPRGHPSQCLADPLELTHHMPCGSKQCKLADQEIGSRQHILVHTLNRMCSLSHSAPETLVD